MNPAWIGSIVCLFLLTVIICEQKKREKAMLVRIINSKRKNGGERTQMVELAKKFIGKECIIYTFNSQLEGVVIKEVSDGAVLLEKKGTVEAVNLDFVIRIREYPKNKNGKKRSVILD